MHPSNPKKFADDYSEEGLHHNGFVLRNYVTLLGYAVIDPDIPIVGPAGRMNDNYVSDLRNSLWAVIDELDKRGIIDRDRLAVGGHSYGAFSTANALAHTPFFKAGIAGDGNYNRTLTMMTFQTERRQFWDARETYLEMSPVLWANRVNGALLMTPTSAPIRPTPNKCSSPSTASAKRPPCTCTHSKATGR